MEVAAQNDAALYHGLADELDAAGAEDLGAAGDFVAAVLIFHISFIIS